MHIAERFEILLVAYPRPDGQAWSGQDIDDATGGIVTRSYVTNLRKRRIDNPGYEKLRAIAKALSFPPELWFDDDPTPETTTPGESHLEHADIAEKVARLMGIPKTEASARSYTDADVARLSFGDLTADDVEAIRTGGQPDPSVEQVRALAGVFGVNPSYFVNLTKGLPLLDQGAMEIFRNETVRTIAYKSLRLKGREQQMVLNIIRQLEASQDEAQEA